MTSTISHAEIIDLKCYKSLNPSEVTITHLDSGNKETANSVKVQTYTEISKYDETEYKSPFMKVIANSKTMKFETIAIKQNNRTYQVECDGGSASVIKIGKIMVLNTKYLAGDVVSSEEGCGTGTISGTDLALKEEACQ